MKTKVKICGICSLEDVRVLNEAGPDFAGFVLAPSKRRVKLEELETLIAYLDPKIIPVGVFVNQDPAYLLQAVAVGIRVLQIHGDESPGYIQELRSLLDRQNSGKIKIWKAVRIGLENEIDKADREFQGLVDGIIVDKYDSNAYGGTGQAFDWNLLRKKHESQEGERWDFPLILAGGLNEDNVKLAISTVNPYCVDVSSGVETNGRKDRMKIRRFIEQLRQCSRL